MTGGSSETLEYADYVHESTSNSVDSTHYPNTYYAHPRAKKSKPRAMGFAPRQAYATEYASYSGGGKGKGGHGGGGHGGGCCCQDHQDGYGGGCGDSSQLNLGFLAAGATAFYLLFTAITMMTRRKRASEPSILAGSYGFEQLGQIVEDIILTGRLSLFKYL